MSYASVILVVMSFTSVIFWYFFFKMCDCVSVNYVRPAGMYDLRNLIRMEIEIDQKEKFN